MCYGGPCFPEWVRTWHTPSGNIAAVPLVRCSYGCSTLGWDSPGSHGSPIGSRLVSTVWCASCGEILFEAGEVSTHLVSS